MKFCKLFNSFVPRLKCGIDPVSAYLVGTGVSSSLGLAGDFASNEQSAANVQMQLAAQREENQKNRDWQTEQAEISRQFTTSEREAQQAFQTSERSAIAAENLRQSERMAAVNAGYNSPVYQRQELTKAGLNPNVYFGKNSSFAGSSQSALAGSPSSAPSGVPPHGVGSVAGLSPVSFQPLHLRVPELQQSLASLIEAGTKAKTAPAQIKALLSQAIDNEKDAKHKEMLAEYQDLANQIFIQTSDARIQKAFVEVELLRQQKILAEKQGKNFDKQSELAEAQKKLDERLEKLKGEELFKLTFLNARLEDWYTNEQNYIKSQTNLASQQAEESKARTKDVLFWYELNNQEREYLVKNIHNDAAQRYNNVRMSDYQKELLQYAIQQAKFATSTQEIKFWNELITSDLKMLFDGAAEFSKVKAFKELNTVQKQRVLQKEREFNSIRVDRDRKIMDSRTGEPFVEHETFYR